MKKVVLVPHNKKFAEAISSLSSEPPVRNALSLTESQTSIEGTLEFIEFVQEQEQLGKQYSRVIFNEDGDLIGIITLKDINMEEKTCNIGTWIGHRYWGKGYNESAKSQILHTAFTELDLEYVFVAVKLSNIRSRKALEKLPYIRTDVQEEFPEEYKKLEPQINAPFMLHVIEKSAFLEWYSENTEE
ncbi:MAG: GNAT family N-acetyltransferase [Bacilli bacterium]|jgi:RimJ/RimL family protein N-acetyltransferase|uniref:GNAT family N-acetyltransferase n=1 Tax=Ureibacillus suwonensis TaxID=313007 RepID=A0ABW0RCV3_9BACL|nr:N-acetyltransferase [Bacilli bacterium]